ncbi:MAG TPA: site-2 protease family protein [Streptosporangiaceae bacterium]|nr:site-2 protease family protein [Streptosporangiaceae bacterium]
MGHQIGVLIGVLIFVVALLTSVMLHEAGHLFTAKAFGMKATRFFVGFGNTLWSRVRGETEYGIKSVPLGGFVDITGMSNLDEVDPADEPRTFRAKPAWQRSVVLLAGSFMHFVIAIVVLLAVAIVIGEQNTAVVSISPCVPVSKTSTSCPAGAARSPAALAGLRNGDKIVAVDGRPVGTWTQLTDQIAAHNGGTAVAFTVSRNGQQFTKEITLARLPWRKGGFLGVQEVPFLRVSPLAATAYAGSQFGTAVTSSVQGLAKLPSEIPQLFSANRAKSGGGVSSVVGVGEITGQVVSAAGVSWQEKASFVLLIVASVNVFVGLFNLLPFLPLDGGKLAVVIFEWLRSVLARLRRRPDPGPVDMRKLIPLSVGFLALFVCLGVLLIAADIFNPIHLTQ